MIFTICVKSPLGQCETLYRPCSEYLLEFSSKTMKQNIFAKKFFCKNCKQIYIFFQEPQTNNYLLRTFARIANKIKYLLTIFAGLAKNISNAILHRYKHEYKCKCINTNRNPQNYNWPTRLIHHKCSKKYNTNDFQ